MSILSKSVLVDQSKLCTQIYLQKFANCINLQLAIRIKKITPFSDMHYPLTDIQANFEINRALDIKWPRKEVISTDDRRHGRQTDGRTDGQTPRTTTIGSFFCQKTPKNHPLIYPATRGRSDSLLLNNVI